MSKIKNIINKYKNMKDTIHHFDSEDYDSMKEYELNITHHEE